MNYDEKLERESRKWGSHLEVEASGEWSAWLDHPLVLSNYNQRARIDGMTWPRWVRERLGGPAACSLDLGCGAAGNSIRVFDAGASRRCEGIDISEERIAEAEARRRQLTIPGLFWVGDVNRIELTNQSYDLIFSCHSFHHFLNLEHVMEQVRSALTPSGLFDAVRPFRA